MIEQALIFALGFLLCGLLSLLVLPAFWRRAMRLSTRRLEMLMPLSMAEALAQRDQVRAQAAVEQRRIEQKLEAMTQDRARHMSEIGRRAGLIARLETEVERLDAALRAREVDLRDAWAELGGLHSHAHDLATRLEASEANRGAHERLIHHFDALRMEKAVLETQAESLKAQDHDLRERLASLQQERDQLVASLERQRASELEASERHERRGLILAEMAIAKAMQIKANAQAGNERPAENAIVDHMPAPQAPADSRASAS